MAVQRGLRTSKDSFSKHSTKTNNIRSTKKHPHIFLALITLTVHHVLLFVVAKKKLKDESSESASESGSDNASGSESDHKPSKDTFDPNVFMVNTTGKLNHDIIDVMVALKKEDENSSKEKSKDSDKDSDDEKETKKSKKKKKSKKSKKKKGSDSDSEGSDSS